MKVRQGFVSNSSSSSFIVIASIEDYDRIFKEMNPYEQKIADNLFENGEVDGKSIRFLFGEFGSDVPETLTDFEYFEEEEHLREDPGGLFKMRDEAFDKIIKRFTNQPGILSREDY